MPCQSLLLPHPTGESNEIQGCYVFNSWLLQELVPLSLTVNNTFTSRIIVIQIIALLLWQFVKCKANMHTHLFFNVGIKG